jgi:PAS domain S-box-containing protein
MARKQVEETLACERRTSKEILQTIEAMVLMLDAEGRILHLNRAVQEVSGFSLDDVRRRRIWELFPVVEEASLFSEIFRRLRQGTKSVEYESSLLTKDSRRRRIAWSYGAIHGAGGELESVVATGIDISGQRAAEEELKRAEQVIQQLRQDPVLPGSPAAESRGGGSAAKAGADSPATGSVSAGTQVSDAGGRDRRRRERRPYLCKQAIAPIVGGKIPAAEDFIDVQCHDISEGGFSFFSVGPPTSDSFVIVLGQPPRMTHVTAQVAHVRRVEHDGRRMYLIGCNYTGRITRKGG